MNEPIERTDELGNDLLMRAAAVWRRSQVVHQSPSWEGQPEARALAEEIALHREFELPLWSLLADPNQLVIAYALIALELMNSNKLTSLPDSLIANRSKLTLQFGSVRNVTDLAGFARGVSKRAKLSYDR